MGNFFPLLPRFQSARFSVRGSSWLFVSIPLQMGAAKCLKIIASQVSDRENTVRSAALDAIVTVYNIVGEDVYKLMGNIGEKNTRYWPCETGTSRGEKSI